MQRRSQGDTNLVSLTDIKALERTIKRARLRAMASNPEAVGVDIGQASGEIHAAGSNPEQVPDITAEDAGLYEDALPVRRSPQRQARVPRAAREREYEEEYQRIGEFDEPGTRRPKTGIQVPRIPNANFQMNHGLTQSVQDLRFTGYEGENPLDHLDMFDRLCALYKVNGVPTEALKMMVFPFSLGGQAAMWEKEIPSDLVTTWEDVRKEFLNMFFPKQRTAKARASISGFRQRPGENFHEAWSRFQGYIRSCPHHGFGRDAILGIFYRGCNSRYRELLDSSSGGNFADFTVIEGESLISKMARSGRHVGDDEYDRERTPLRDARVNDVTTKMGGASISQPRNREVRFVEEEPNQEYEESQAELYYIDSRRDLNYRPPYNNGYNARPNLGGTHNWRPTITNPAPYQPPRPSNQGYQRPSNSYQNQPPSGPSRNQESTHAEGIAEIKKMIQTIIDTQKADKIDINARVDDMVNSFDSKIDALSGRFTGLQTHVRNLEKELVAITPGVSNRGDEKKRTSEDKGKYKEFGQFLDSDDDTDSEYNSEEPIHGNPDPNQFQEETLPLQHHLVTGSIQVETYNKVTATLEVLDSSTEANLLKQTDLLFRQQCERLASCKSRFESIPNLVESSRPYPLITLSAHLGAARSTNLDDRRIVEVDEGITLDPDIADTEVHSSSSRPNRELLKREDPGVFLIPCLIKGIPFEKCVLDLGASKSIMPVHAFQKIRLREVEATETTMVLANWSTIKPVGLARDVPVVLAGTTIPTDFLVIDTGERSSKIILGRPFLASAGAVINVREKTVEFETWNNPSKISIGKSNNHDQRQNPLTIDFLKDIASEVVEHEYVLNANPGDWNPRRTRDEAGPSRRRPRIEWQNLVGTGETNYNTSDGEEESPSEQELDPGDIPSTTPRHAPSS